jgi:hypothetical protein
MRGEERCVEQSEVERTEEKRSGRSRGRCMMWESEGAKWREEYRGWHKCGREMNM